MKFAAILQIVLQDMKRPFKPMKDLDMEKVILDIIDKIKLITHDLASDIACPMRKFLPANSESNPNLHCQNDEKLGELNKINFG